MRSEFLEASSNKSQIQIKPEISELFRTDLTLSVQSSQNLDSSTNRLCKSGTEVCSVEDRIGDAMRLPFRPTAKACKSVQVGALHPLGICEISKTNVLIKSELHEDKNHEADPRKEK